MRHRKNLIGARMTVSNSEFQSIADALHGSGGYSTGANLVRYASETDDQYARRQEVAWYVNDLLPACRRFVGYLTKKPPIRDTENPLLDAFIDDCDWRGNSLDVFWQSFMIDAQARGSMLLLVDMPRTLPADAASQIDARAYPYLVAIAPETVYAYRLDERGRLDMLEIHDTLSTGEWVIRGWDVERWWVRIGDKEIDGDRHALGACPVLAFTDTGDFPNMGGFSGIANLSLRLYNLRSELDEILRRHTFPIFAAQFPMLEPVDNELPESLAARQKGLIEALKTAITNLGRDRGIVAPGEVAFVAPPEGPAVVYQQAISAIQEKINEIGLTVDMPGDRAAESGLALTIRFQALNSALTSFARRMEDLERRALDLVCKWLGLDQNVITTQWSSDYQLSDVAAEMEILGAMQASGFPDEAISAQMMRVAQLQFAAADPDTMSAVTDAIHAGGQER